MARHKERITMSRAFLEGLARIFDPFSNVNVGPHRGRRKKTDTEMLRSDWITIGRDMQKVLGDMSQKEQKDTVR